MVATFVREGHERPVEVGRPVSEVLTALGLDPAEAVLKLNGANLRRQLYESTVLRDRDVLRWTTEGRPPDRKSFAIESSDDPGDVKALIGEWAEGEGYRLTNDPRALNATVKGLIRNAGKYGEPLCPCMPKEITGDPAQDEAIACPCVYMDSDIKVQGACKCKLFVSVEYHDNMAAVLDGMTQL